MSYEELVKKSTPLKSLLQLGERALSESSTWSEVWHTRQQLEDIYAKMLVVDFRRSLSEKTEQDLWNLCFRMPINALQSAARKGAAPSSKSGGDALAYLSSLLDAATGFYTRLIAAVKRRYVSPQLDAAVLLGADFSESPPQVAEQLLARRAASIDADLLGDFLHNSYVHLGDIERYRNDPIQAATWYRVAIRVSNSRQGQAFNQLAIVETAMSSVVSATASTTSAASTTLRVIYLYTRSVGATHPFIPAEANLINTLRKCAARFVSAHFEPESLELEPSFLLIHASCLIRTASDASWWPDSSHSDNDMLVKIMDSFASKLHFSLSNGRAASGSALRSNLIMMCAVTCFSIWYVRSKLQSAQQKIARLQPQPAFSDSGDAHLRFVDDGEIEAARESENSLQQLAAEVARLSQVNAALVSFTTRFVTALLRSVRDEFESSDRTESVQLEVLTTMLNALRFDFADYFADTSLTKPDQCGDFWDELSQLANHSLQAVSDVDSQVSLSIDAELAGFVPIRNSQLAYGLGRPSLLDRAKTVDVALSRIRAFCNWLVAMRVHGNPRGLLMNNGRFATDVWFGPSAIPKTPGQRMTGEAVDAPADLKPTPNSNPKQRTRSKNVALQSILASGKQQSPSAVSPKTSVTERSETSAQLQVHNEGPVVSAVKSPPKFIPLSVQALLGAGREHKKENGKQQTEASDLSNMPLLTDLEECLRNYQTQMNQRSNDALANGNDWSSTSQVRMTENSWVDSSSSESVLQLQRQFGQLSCTVPNNDARDSASAASSTQANSWQVRIPAFNAVVGSNKPTPSGLSSPMNSESSLVSGNVTESTTWSLTVTDEKAGNAGSAWSSFLPSPLERAVREAQLSDPRSQSLAATHEQHPG